MYGFVYITTNTVNGKKYVGQKTYTKNWENYLGSGIHLKNAIEKYGRENFKREIIEVCDCKNDLNKAEIKWIEYYNAVESKEFYNISYGGDGALSGEKHHLYGKKHSDITKIKMSEKAKLRVGESNPFYGKKHSESVREMLKESATNREKSLSERLAISERTKGENNPMYGKNHSEESKIKNRLAHLGKKHSELTKRKMSKNNVKKRKVVCLNTNQVFDSIESAAKFANRPSQNIYRVCKGERKSCGVHPKTNEKLKWAYFEQSAE